MLIAKYTCNASGVVPTFNSGYVYEVNETENNGVYTVEITSEDDFSSCSFNGKSQLLTVEYLKVTSKVTTMNGMFGDCSNLTTLDVSNWNTSNVTTMANMFRDCYKLTNLDLSKWNTSKTIDMYAMFDNCRVLTNLDLSNFNTDNVTNIAYMIGSTPFLTDIGMLYCSKDTVNEISSMITNGNKTIWVKDTKASDYTPTEFATFKDYGAEKQLKLNSPLLEGDKIVKMNGKMYHYHKMGKVVFDGVNEGWTYYQQTANINHISFFISQKDATAKYGYRASDKFPTRGHWNLDVEGIAGDSSSPRHAISIARNKLATQDINGFKQWLQQNPTTVVYELAEPYYEDITPIQSSFVISTVSEGDMEILTDLPIKSNITYLTNITSAVLMEQQLDELDNSTESLTNIVEDDDYEEVLNENFNPKLYEIIENMQNQVNTLEENNIDYLNILNEEVDE